MANNYSYMWPSETNLSNLTVIYFSWFSELRFSLFIQVHVSVTIRTKRIILGIHLLLHHVISVHDPHLAFTYVTWSIDFVSPAKQKRDICIAFPASSLSSSSAA